MTSKSPVAGVPNCHTLEHEGVAAQPQGLSAGGRDVLEDDCFGLDVRIGLQVGIVGQIPIEIRKYGRSWVIVWVLAVVDVKGVDGDSCGHKTGVTKIVLSRIEAPDQTGCDRFAARGHKDTVAKD